MRYLSLFSGIEAASVAWEPLGWECVGVAEIEKFPCKVLAHHYPEVPNLGDITKITEADITALGQIDLVVFGAPCQDLSVAGKRKGMLDADGNITRSGLFFTAINIVHWARKHCGCRFALYENVPGLFSSNKGADFASVVEHMAGLDDITAPKNGWGNEGCAVGDEGMVEWAVLDAQFVRTPEYPTAVPQRRRRVFALADFGDWASRPPILLERESLRGNTPTRRKAGQENSRDVAESTYACGGIGTFSESSVSSPILQSGADLGNGCESLIAFTARDYGNDASDNLAPTMRSLLVGADGHQSGSHGLDIAFQQNTRDEVRLMNGDGQIAGALAAQAGMKQQNYIATTFKVRCGCEGGGKGYLGSEEHAFTLATSHDQDVFIQPIGLDEEQNAVVDGFGTLKARVEGGGGFEGSVMPSNMQVRRLTPLECERLQGFPDNYTNIVGSSDSTRYKALGNSMACNVMNYIGERIQMAVDYK